MCVCVCVGVLQKLYFLGIWFRSESVGLCWLGDWGGGSVGRSVGRSFGGSLGRSVVCVFFIRCFCCCCLLFVSLFVCLFVRSFFILLAFAFFCLLLLADSLGLQLGLQALLAA